MTLANSHQKLRLLFLLPFAPRLDAPHGGGRAMAQLLTRLAARHYVALLYLRAANEPPLDETLQAQCDLAEEVIRHPFDRATAQLWAWRIHLIKSLLNDRPIWVTEWAVTAYELRARAIVETWQPDLVQIEYHLMGQYASALDGCRAPRVLVEYEPGIKAAPYLQASHPVIRQIMHYFDAIAWKRYEPSIIKKMQTVVVFTEEDRQALAPFAQSTPVVRIPLGTELSQQSLNQLDHRPLSLLFVGNFVHPPNVDAAHRLINSIFPQVRERCPEVSLYIVGSQPSPFSKTRNENVILTGYVPDVTPYLDQAAVVVAPLRLGGGMRVKVLEALAAGKVVVASPLAVEGLNVVDGEQVMLAETDEQFCQTIVQLLESPERRDRLARNARAWACANLGWEKSIEAYETLYQSLLHPSPPVD